MAEDVPEMISFERSRFDTLLQGLERMAVGDLGHQLPLSSARDELDALSHGINVMAGELLYRLKELQQAQTSIVQTGRLAALGEVSSGLAHELNNPLAIIRGYVEQLLLTQEAPATADVGQMLAHVRKIDQQVERMAAIIRHIMEFARQSKPVRLPVKLHEVIRKSLILIGEQMRLRNIRLELYLSPEDFTISADAVQLEQVFINLMTNARDAIEAAGRDRGGAIRIRTAASDDKEVLVTVEDDGAGMEPEIIDRIFDPFFTTKEVGRGTGLGLSISLGIVQDHNGSIQVESSPGRGAKFTVRLPLA